MGYDNCDKALIWSACDCLTTDINKFVSKGKNVYNSESIDGHANI